MDRKRSLPNFIPLYSRKIRHPIQIESFRRTHRRLQASGNSQPLLPDLQKQNSARRRMKFLSHDEDTGNTLWEFKSISTTKNHDNKAQFYSTYRDIDRINQRNKLYNWPASPQTEYINQTIKMQILPKPMGMTQRSLVAKNEIDINRLGIGENYAKAFSKSLQKLPKITVLDLQGNRLTHVGINRILKNLKSNNLTKLDLTDNKIDDKTVKHILKMLYSRDSNLETLNLEKTSLSTNSAIKLFQNIVGNKTITSLNVANNRLSDKAGSALAELLMYNQTLKKLDLHWNMLNREGAESIFEALRTNSTLTELDMSFNSLGKRDYVVLQMCEMFKENKSLRHIDLSWNSFTKDQIDVMAEWIADNHTILGIHMVGNECDVDSKGFLSTADRPSSAMKSHIMTRVINKPTAIANPRTFSNCWLCEKWVECQFVWFASDEAMKDPIYLHLSCDDYKPELLTQTRVGKFEITRVVPQGLLNFFFSHNNTSSVLISSHYPVRELDTPMVKSDSIIPDIVVTRNIYRVNEIEANGNHIRIDLWDQSQPRIPSNEFDYPTEFRPKTPWSIPISVFKSYEFDDDYHLGLCFEFDWSCSKIPRVVKKPKDLEEVKEVLRRHYKYIRETYKYHAAVGINGGMFAVSSNVFTDFCYQCNIVDPEGFKLADVDFNIKATCYNEVKNNPRNPANALVRFEFMEILARAAIDKYYKTGICNTQGEAMQQLIDDMLTNMKKYDSNTWRWDKYICEEVDLVYKAYTPLVEAIYKKYSGKAWKPGQKNFMSLEELQTLVEDLGLLNDQLVQREIDICFNLAMMTQKDELNFDRHFQMNYVEFLEAFGRIADQANVRTPKPGNPVKTDLSQDPKTLTLSQKIENIMPRLMAIAPPTVQDTFRYPESSPLYGTQNPSRRTSTLASIVPIPVLAKKLSAKNVESGQRVQSPKSPDMLGAGLENKMTLSYIEDEEGKPSIKKSDRTVNENAQWASSSMLKSSSSNLQLTLDRQPSRKSILK